MSFVRVLLSRAETRTERGAEVKKMGGHTTKGGEAGPGLGAELFDGLRSVLGAGWQSGRYVRGLWWVTLLHQFCGSVVLPG